MTRPEARSTGISTIAEVGMRLESARFGWGVAAGMITGVALGLIAALFIVVRSAAH